MTSTHSKVAQSSICSSPPSASSSSSLSQPSSISSSSSPSSSSSSSSPLSSSPSTSPPLTLVFFLSSFFLSTFSFCTFFLCSFSSLLFVHLLSSSFSSALLFVTNSCHMTLPSHTPSSTLTILIFIRGPSSTSFTARFSTFLPLFCLILSLPASRFKISFLLITFLVPISSTSTSASVSNSVSLALVYPPAAGSSR